MDRAEDHLQAQAGDQEVARNLKRMTQITDQLDGIEGASLFMFYDH